MSMKRILLSAVMPMAILAATAGNLDKLFNEFKEFDNVEYIKVPRALLWAAKATGSLSDLPVAKNITGVKVLAFNNVAKNTKTKFEKRLKQESEGFEEIIRVTDNESRVCIYSQTEGETFRDIYIWAGDGNDATFVRLGGTFTTSDLSKILNDK